LRDPALLGQFTWSLRVGIVTPNGPPPKGGQLPGTDIDVGEPEFLPAAQIPAEDRKLFERLTQ
jgi:hypothetical protein